MQSKLIAASARPRGKCDTLTDPRILTGKLRDETGDLLTPTHTQRHGRRFSYYVSNRLIAGGTDPTGWRLPAEALEATLRQIVAAHLRKAADGHAILAVPEASGAAILHRRVLDLADRIESDTTLLGTVIASGTLGQGRLRLQLDAAVVAAELDKPLADIAAGLLQVSQPFTLRRRGIETRIIAGETVPAPDPVLQRTLAEAHLWARALRKGTSLTSIAHGTGLSEPYIRTRISHAFLPPDLQAAILEGKQPADLSVAQIVRDDLPLDWAEQRRLFGLG